MIDFLLLFCIGFIQSLLVILIGNVFPIFIAFMQIFFPSLSFANIIALNKCMGVVGNGGAMKSFWKDIDWVFIKKNSALFLLGSVVGSFIVNSMSHVWILPLLVFAFILAEYAEKISQYISKKMITTLELGMGVYAGIFGAYIIATLTALFRIQEPDNQKITFLRIQVLVLLFFSSCIGLVTHIIAGAVPWELAIPFMFGSLFGGLLGGRLTQKMQKLSGKIQKNIMRGSLLFGIIMSAWMIFQ